LFSIAFAFVEASVVVYLRAIYYPAGFEFPLKLISPDHLKIELLREGFTIVMLVGVGILSGRKPWERFACFLIAFGVWDIFYYVWLKLAIDWPKTLTDWDVLFLIPIPWIAPVLAPALISALMTIIGVLILVRISSGLPLSPSLPSWLVSIAATLILLYSFLSDIPYAYRLLWTGLSLYVLGFFLACRRTPVTPATVL
jgi:hypothetical protein